jgi:predicted amidophosphoribosyltransferase
VFDSFTNAVVCRRCGGVLDHSRSEYISLKEVNEHIVKCSAEEELRQLFVEVDDNLRPYLLEYKDSNRYSLTHLLTHLLTHSPTHSALMWQELCDAIARFEEMNQRANIAYHLLRRVIYIHSNAADGKRLQSLQKEIEDAIRC